MRIVRATIRLLQAGNEYDEDWIIFMEIYSLAHSPINLTNTTLTSKINQNNLWIKSHKHDFSEIEYDYWLGGFHVKFATRTNKPNEEDLVDQTIIQQSMNKERQM